MDVLDGYSFLYPEYWSPVTVRHLCPEFLHVAVNSTMTRTVSLIKSASRPSNLTNVLYTEEQTSGNDVFYRNPYNVEENLFVNITSPSSSKFDSVQRCAAAACGVHCCCSMCRIRVSPWCAAHLYLCNPRSLGSPDQAAQRLRQQYLSEFMSTRLGSRKTADIISASSRSAEGRLYYDIEVSCIVQFQAPPHLGLRYLAAPLRRPILPASFRDLWSPVTSAAEFRIPALGSSCRRSRLRRAARWRRRRPRSTPTWSGNGTAACCSPSAWQVCTATHESNRPWSEGKAVRRA